MKLAIWDQEWNPYVSKMFLAPLEQFARDSGISVKRITDPVPEYGWTMVCNAGLLNQTLVQHFDANRCPIVAISCNDSAYLTENISEFFHQIPLLFTISGVQKVNYSDQSYIQNSAVNGIQVYNRVVQFLSDEEWNRYAEMHKSGRLLPLPYVPWDRLDDVPVPAQKTPKILFRGGNHFWRFITFLHALKNGVAHPASGFLTRDYFEESMVPQFQYCQQCRDEWNANGKRIPFQSNTRLCECTVDLSLNDPLKWNNRSPRAFYWLTEQFQVTHGTIDLQTVEQTLNFQRQPAEHHLCAIADAAFFADCKWEFSIPFAQRTWEAASVNTINLAPRRAADQEYFPRWEEGKHFECYENDFSSGIGPSVIYSEQIAKNARDTYEHWIRPSKYVTNTNLLDHILSKIKEVAA